MLWTVSCRSTRGSGAALKMRNVIKNEGKKRKGLLFTGGEVNMETMNV